MILNNRTPRASALVEAWLEMYPEAARYLKERSMGDKKTLRLTAKQILRVTVVIELSGKDAIEHGAEAVERVLDTGVLQDAINAKAFIADQKILVTSALTMGSVTMPRFE